MNNDWTFTDGFNKGLTETGEKAWILIYNSGIRFLSENMAGLTHNTTLFLNHVATLRNRKGPTTRQWNPMADQIGLKGELVVLKRMGFSAEQSLELFLKGLKGDSGWDFKVSEWRVDVKTTTTPNAQFRFNCNNKQCTQANAYCLVQQKITQHSRLETFHILGWAPKHKMKSYFRPHGKDSERVLSASLLRDGILREINSLESLKRQIEQGESCL